MTSMQPADGQQSSNAAGTPTQLKTALGVLEVASRGDGPSVLVLHGSPGGIDSAEVMSAFLPSDAFRVITLSRPGYLGTPPLSSGGSIDEEADLLAGALDVLGIDAVRVFAWSGGGPVAYRLAALHPDRVLGMVAVACISDAWWVHPQSRLEAFVSDTPMGQWVLRELADRAPRYVVHGALSSEGKLRGRKLTDLTTSVLAKPVQREAVLGLARTGGTVRRRHGWETDVANFASIRDLGLEDVRCPVLLIHGDADADVDISYSEFAHVRLRISDLRVVSDGTHLCFFADPASDELQEEARRFLRLA